MPFVLTACKSPYNLQADIRATRWAADCKCRSLTIQSISELRTLNDYVASWVLINCHFGSGIFLHRLNPYSIELAVLLKDGLLTTLALAIPVIRAVDANPAVCSRKATSIGNSTNLVPCQLFVNHAAIQCFVLIYNWTFQSTHPWRKRDLLTSGMFYH